MDDLEQDVAEAIHQDYGYVNFDQNVRIVSVRCSNYRSRNHPSLRASTSREIVESPYNPWESNGSQAQEASTSQEDNESSEEASENPNMAAESDSANSEPSFPNHAGLTLPGHGLSNILYFIHYIDNNGYEIFQIEDPEDTENTYSNDNLMMDLGDITNNGNISNEQQALAVTMQREEALKKFKAEMGPFIKRPQVVETCCVCFEEMAVEEDIEKLPCTHRFHIKCVAPWFKNSRTCPNCRLSIDMK